MSEKADGELAAQSMFPLIHTILKMRQAKEMRRMLESKGIHAKIRTWQRTFAFYEMILRTENDEIVAEIDKWRCYSK